MSQKQKHKHLENYRELVCYTGLMEEDLEFLAEPEEDWRAFRDSSAGRKAKIVGNNLKYLRGDCSLQVLSEYTRIPKEDIYLIEQGRRVAGKSILVKLAKALKADVSEFYTDLYLADED